MNLHVENWILEILSLTESQQCVMLQKEMLLKSEKVKWQPTMS